MKFQKLTQGLILAVAFATAIPSAHAWFRMLDDKQCSQDSVGTRAEAQERLNWAFKCLPDVMDELSWHPDANANVHRSPHGTQLVYPVFGLVAGDSTVSVLAAPRSGDADCGWLAQAAPGVRIRAVGYCGVPDEICYGSIFCGRAHLTEN